MGGCRKSCVPAVYPGSGPRPGWPCWSCSRPEWFIIRLEFVGQSGRSSERAPESGRCSMQPLSHPLLGHCVLPGPRRAYADRAQPLTGWRSPRRPKLCVSRGVSRRKPLVVGRSTARGHGAVTDRFVSARTVRRAASSTPCGAPSSQLRKVCGRPCQRPDTVCHDPSYVPVMRCAAPFTGDQPLSRSGRVCIGHGDLLAEGLTRCRLFAGRA